MKRNTKNKKIKKSKKKSSKKSRKQRSVKRQNVSAGLSHGALSARNTNQLSLSGHSSLLAPSTDTILESTTAISALPKPKTSHLHLVRSEFPYKFHPMQFGISVNVLVPKVLHLQSELYKIIRHGFDIEKVKKHFLDSSKAPRIKELLNNYPFLKDYTRDDINNMQQVFYGCSIAEVFGCFYSDTSVLYEESSLDVRIILLPDLEEFYEDNPKNENLVINTALSTLNNRFGNEHIYFEKEHKGNLKKKVITTLKKWLLDVGLFLFGYIVFELSEHIVNLCSAEELPWRKAEEEFWVLSAGRVDLNRIVLQKSFT